MQFINFKFFSSQGHDTTNSAIAFILYNIGKHQAIQQKCFDEIREVVGDDLTTRVNMKFVVLDN